MVKFSLGIILLLTQLSGPGGQLPQVMEPSYSKAPISGNHQGEVTVSFDVKSGYLINRIPPIQLKLQEVDGLTLNKLGLVSLAEDPKSTDEYYVDIPSFGISIETGKPGKYKIPAKLIYFFCSKADGFCSRQVVDTRIPLTVN